MGNHFEFDPDRITTMSLWITLPRLFVGYKSFKELSKIVNQFITSIKQTTYARVCIELDASLPIIDSIEIETPSGIFHQPVDYYWKHKFHGHCLRFGHHTNNCNLHEQNKAPKKNSMNQEGGEEINEDEEDQ
ncbi:hypothetical protein FXO38_02368 [Capsicum annuum]|nr:hypothetical protein FXO38_02368 [Capsicum annuum]KAF3682574.1 hypothetical protein FXO37_02255 [Capsicum annuum]